MLNNKQQKRASVKDVITFIRLTADLLREKLPYDEILTLLAQDTENRRLRLALQEICQGLKSGQDSQLVFGKQAEVLGKFPARILGATFQSNGMVESYESVAKTMEHQEEFRKNLKSALAMPLIVVTALTGAVIFYMTYVFPETANKFLEFNLELLPLTAGMLKISELLQHYVLYLFGGAGVAAMVFVTSAKVRCQISKCLFRLPIIGVLIQQTATEIWCRAFQALYLVQGDKLEACRIAAENCGNLYVRKQIEKVTLPMMQKGVELTEALARAGIFSRQALFRLRLGEESFALGDACLELANGFEKETTGKFRSFVDFVQVGLALLIMIVMTAITIISSEIAVTHR